MKLALSFIVLSCFYLLPESCSNKSSTSGDKTIVVTPAKAEPDPARVLNTEELTKFNAEHLLGTWKLDSVQVGMYWVTSQMIDGDWMMQFTNDAQLIATTSQTKHISHYTINGNSIMAVSMDADQVSYITIEKLTRERLVIRIKSADGEARMILYPRP